MADVFVSYAREDRNFARKLAAALESGGSTVWWDRDIPAGAAYDSTIERELDAARCVVVLWSAASTISEWVKNEASAAVERGVLLPVLIEQVKLPLEFRRRQAVDLSRWDGNVSHEGFKQICDGIRVLRTGATPRGTGSLASNPLQPSRRNRLILVAASTVAVLAVAAILAIGYRPSAKLHPTPSSGLSLADVTFTGKAHWSGKGDRDERATDFTLTLSASGQSVRGRYVDYGTGDKGTVQLSIEGNGLVGDLVSDGIAGRCPLTGTLTSGGNGLEATYYCADGERGRLSLVRK